MVAIAGPRTAPLLLTRKRVELADRGIAGSPQLYHKAAEMSLPDATAFVRKCVEATAAMASDAIRDAVIELTRQGYEFGGAAVLLGSGRPLGNLASILASHPLIHTAEGVFYRDAIQSACKECGFEAVGIAEKNLVNEAAKRLRMPAGELEMRLSEMGKKAGPPWTQDQKLSALAAWTLWGRPPGLP